MEVQATITECSASLVAEAGLMTKSSFIQETSVFTRLISRILFSKHCAKNTPFIWYSDVVLTKQFRKVFPAKSFTLELHNKVFVFCLWIGKKDHICYFQLSNHFLRASKSTNHKPFGRYTNQLGWEIPQSCILQLRLRQQQPQF